jgi:peptidoglycan L-alanyl-D-glutamate endopeptidase CwlK
MATPEEFGAYLQEYLPKHKFHLGVQSLQRLSRVHEDLQKVVKRAIQLTTVDFGVSEGLRTAHRQKELFEAGASQTMASRHLTGHAVDLVCYVGHDISWDWPLYTKVSWAMKKAAAELGTPITWGGDWKSFKDGPHYELPWKDYPE